MISQVLTEAPAYFNEKVRLPGQLWFEQNPQVDRPKAYWQHCVSDLALAFRHLCGYSAMMEMNGTVDHYLSCKNRPDLAYEWSNYRYVSGWLNSSKQNADDTVLDPFEVQDDWFELLLPSLLLTTTDHIPEEYREKAEFTLRRLKLINGTNVMRQRQAWYRLYNEGKIPLSGLQEVAPLLAKAIQRQQNSSF